VSESFAALGTTALVATVDDEGLAAAVAVVRRELAAVDAACSRFRDDSELMRVARAGGRAIPVSQLLLDAVAAAVDAARATDGIVDPTVGRTMRLAGYDATFRIVQARDGDGFRARFEPLPGWRTIELDRDAGTLRVPEGVELDLGATAKAFAADRCAARAADAAGCGALVALGGDVAVAGIAPERGWPIGIADDHAAPAADVQETVAIRDGGLATSSTTVRRWRSGSETMHHLIDPRTARPADSCWRTASVAAASCLDANVASTAAIILGRRAPAWLELRGLSARLVGNGGAIVTTGGWPTPAQAA
jgi:FAD:protein FMN transferase